jgi:hypothetical protein
MKFADRSPIPDDKTRAAAEVADEVRGRQAILDRDAPKLPPPPAMV